MRGMSDSGCPRCAEMRTHLEAALEERDRALLELARAREELNAARLREEWKDEEEIPLYPLDAGAALPVPLRYRLADKLNRWTDPLSPVKRRVRAWLEKTSGR
jgi:hypothetical protein